MEDLLFTALAEYGVKEVPGPENNPRIMDYFQVIGQNWVQGDETAWCSAFVNYCAKTSGYEYTGKLNARSWLEIGYEVKTPRPGDIVIFWRESPESWKGHVALYINALRKYQWVLGGNQSNMVKISTYPDYQLLEYRRLARR